MIRTLFISLACLEQCSKHPGKQEEIVIKGSFEIQYVTDLHFTTLFLFPFPCKSLGRFAWWLALLWYIIYAWGAVEWQLCNEDENRSLLWREKKPLFPLTGAWGLSLCQLRMWGRVVVLWGAVLENPARDCGGLSGAADQQLCFVSVSIILSRVESTWVCAKLLACRTRSRIASLSCAEDISKDFFPTLTALTGFVIYSVVVYLLVTKSHALCPIEAVKMCYQSVYCITVS